MRTHSSTTQTTGLAISRRRLTQAAWAAPVVLATTAVPVYAASKTVPSVGTAFFAVSSASEDLETGYRRPSLGFWSPPPSTKPLTHPWVAPPPSPQAQPSSSPSP